MTSNTENLKIAMQTYEEELAKYDAKPNKSNSTKVRNSLMTVNKLTKEVRKDVLTAQKALPVKPRIKKEKEHEPVEEPVEIEEPVVKTKKAIRTKKI
jgi:hypothetical protein